MITISSPKIKLPYLDVRNYGAKVDASPPELTGTDDSGAIQAAIDALPAKGGRIYLPGFCRAHSTIWIPDRKPIKIFGDIEGGSQLWDGAGLVGTMTDGSPILATPDNEDFTRTVFLEDFGIVGNAACGDGIFLRFAVYNCHLKNVCVTRCGGDGIQLVQNWRSKLDYVESRENDGRGLFIDTCSNSQLIACDIIDNDSGNLSINEDGGTDGGYLILGGDYSQYATTGVDNFCIKLGSVKATTIQGIFIEHGILAPDVNIIEVLGWAANNRAKGINIIGNTIGCSATSGAAFPIHIQRADSVKISGNNINHGALAGPMEIDIETQNVVIGSNAITADPVISTDPSCEPVTFEGQKCIQCTFQYNDIAQSADVNPNIAGTTFPSFKLGKRAHLLEIYVRASAALTAGSISCTAMGKNKQATLNSTYQERRAFQQPYKETWAADDTIQARLQASGDLTPNGSLDVLVTFIIAVDNEVQGGW